eukprot:5404407-Pyramimonas_sp.AAC.1
MKIATHSLLAEELPQLPTVPCGDRYRLVVAPGVGAPLLGGVQACLELRQLECHIDPKECRLTALDRGEGCFHSHSRFEGSPCAHQAPRGR